MSLEMKKVRQALNRIAPESLQEAWDNCGMQIDMGRRDVNRLLVCMEINQQVVEEAIEEDIDLIVSHHPLLFRPTKCIDNQTVEGKYLIDLIFTGISVYAAHTSFDRAVGGNNDELARRLGLVDVTGLPVEEDGGETAIGRMGRLLQPETLQTVANRLNQVLGYPGGIRICGDPMRLIQQIGLCTGGAGEYFDEAFQEGCDLYITGEIRHHEIQMARERGLSVIDAGHAGTEWIFTPNMANQLRGELGKEVTIVESKSRVNPVDFVL